MGVCGSRGHSGRSLTIRAGVGSLLSVGTVPSDCTNVVSGVSSRTGGIVALVTVSICDASIGVVVGCVGSQ